MPACACACACACARRAARDALLWLRLLELTLRFLPRDADSDDSAVLARREVVGDGGTGGTGSAFSDRRERVGESGVCGTGGGGGGGTGVGRG